MKDGWIVTALDREGEKRFVGPELGATNGLCGEGAERRGRRHRRTIYGRVLAQGSGQGLLDLLGLDANAETTDCPDLMYQGSFSMPGSCVDRHGHRHAR